MWYTYEYRNKLGALVEDRQGSTGTIVQGKMSAVQIANMQRALTELHGIVCKVILVGKQP